jgi:HPt (histidine-containing phosphotransfer) domain-containing protein
MKNLKEDQGPIDLAYLKSIIDNDEQFKNELFEIFCENVSRNLLKMEEAIESGNANSWYMAAHAFKGSSASIGAFRLSTIMEYAQKHPEENREKKIDLLKNIKEEASLVIDCYKAEILQK